MIGLNQVLYMCWNIVSCPQNKKQQLEIEIIYIAFLGSADVKTCTQASSVEVSK